MKKIYRTLIVLSLLNAHVNFSTSIPLKKGLFLLCSGIELLTSINEIRNTHRHHMDILAENQKQYHSDAPQAIISFISQLAEQRNIQNIHVVVLASAEFADYWCDTPKKTLYLPASCAQELEELLQKNTLTDPEQKKLNEHIASIHHELTHLKHNDGTYTHIYENIIGTIGSFAVIHTTNKMLTKQFPILSTNYAINNIAKIIRGIGIIELTRYIVASNLYSKYEELRADDGIPNKKELLEADILQYEKAHETYLAAIDDVKSSTWQDIAHRSEEHRKTFNNTQVYAMKILPKAWFNKPLVMDVIFHARTLHPSHLRRATRLKKRIAELEKQQAINQANAEIQQ